MAKRKIVRTEVNIWGKPKIPQHSKTKSNSPAVLFQPASLPRGSFFGFKPVPIWTPANIRKVPKKNLTWPQAQARFPRMNPFGDSDRDGKLNMFDCKPFDKKRHSFTQFKYRGTGNDVNAFTAAQRFGGANIKRLKKIGAGRDRVVYQVDKDKVIKIAKNVGGIKQNQSEDDYYLNQSGFRPKFYERGKDYVVMEKVNKLSKTNFKKLKDIQYKHQLDKNNAHEIATSFNKAFPVKESPYGPKDPGYGKVIVDNYAYNDLANYELSAGDITKPSSWGEKEGRIILVDAGGVNARGISSEHKITNIRQRLYRAYIQKEELANMKRSILTSSEKASRLTAMQNDIDNMKEEIKEWDEIQRERRKFRKKGEKNKYEKVTYESPETLQALPQTQVKTMQKLPIKPKIKYTNKPYKYQDKYAEQVVHWKEGTGKAWPKGNEYRHVLEGTGDIFRGASKDMPGKYPFVASDYVEEKLRRIEGHLEDMKRRKNAPAQLKHLTDEQTYEYSYKHNPQEFKAMKRAWDQQPVETRLQAKARDLNLAMLEGKYEKAEKLVPQVREMSEKKQEPYIEAEEPYEEDEEVDTILEEASGYDDEPEIKSTKKEKEPSAQDLIDEVSSEDYKDEDKD